MRSGVARAIGTELAGRVLRRAPRAVSDSLFVHNSSACTCSRGGRASGSVRPEAARDHVLRRRSILSRGSPEVSRRVSPLARRLAARLHLAQVLAALRCATDVESSRVMPCGPRPIRRTPRSMGRRSMGGRRSTGGSSELIRSRQPMVSPDSMGLPRPAGSSESVESPMVHRTFCRRSSPRPMGSPRVSSRLRGRAGVPARQA